MEARYFADYSTDRNRAAQIYQILIGAAYNRQIVTYGMVADIIGYGGSSPLAHPLGHIMRWCEFNGFPPLTVLVVNQETGLPGSGLALAELPKQREAVFNFDWYGVIPPTAEELRAAFAEA